MTDEIKVTELDEKAKNEIKADLFRVLETVDSNEFLGAIIVTHDANKKKNVMKVWGSKEITTQAAVRLLQKAGLLYSPTEPQH